MSVISGDDLHSFYSASVAGLRWLDASANRRFGPNADATWKAFRGELSDRHRLEILVRDAAAQFPSAFAPRIIFALKGLAPDEPFGPDFPELSDRDAVGLLRDGLAARDLAGVLDQSARAWTLEPSRCSVPEVSPTTRIIAAGAGAVVALAKAFAGRRELDFGQQVVGVGDSAADRQLFGLAAALLDSTTPIRVVTAAQISSVLEERAMSNAIRVASDDASAASAAALRT